MLSSCGAGKDSWGSLGQQGDQPLLHLIIKEINPKYSLEGEYWCWNWSSTILATWCEEPTHCKRTWCWERLKAAGEGDDRRWDGWMATLTQWTWVWVNSWSWWWTGKPGVLQFMGSQRDDWMTELANHDTMSVRQGGQSWYFVAIRQMRTLRLRSVSCLSEVAKVINNRKNWD